MVDGGLRRHCRRLCRASAAGDAARVRQALGALGQEFQINDLFRIQIALDTQQAGNLVADHDSASSDDDDPFADQCCAIHYAACSGAPAVVAALAEAGADVNISFHSLFRSVAPPLYLAAERGHRDTVAALLSAGASPDAPVPPRMWTSLHVACASGHADVVVTLLKGGADWATTCRDGLSAKALGEQRLCSLASDRERGTLERALVGQGYEPVHLLFASLGTARLSVRAVPLALQLSELRFRVCSGEDGDQQLRREAKRCHAKIAEAVQVLAAVEATWRQAAGRLQWALVLKSACSPAFLLSEDLVEMVGMRAMLSPHCHRHGWHPSF